MEGHPLARIAVAIAVLATACVAAIAPAGPTDPPPPPDDGAELWVRVAGAGFGQRTSQLTPIELDFYDIAFVNAQHGLAAGARCREDVIDQGEADADLGRRLDTCDRVPEIWAYGEDAAGVGTWSRAELEGAGASGYVGAIAWLGSTRALAVGGDGAYPAREPEATEESFDTRVAHDTSGHARAWLYDPARFGDESWHELTGLPAEMRGLSALDVRRGGDWGWAGGLGQLWNWRDGGFADTPVDRTTVQRARTETPTDPPDDVPVFEFRVRDIRLTGTSRTSDVFAVTAGCCDVDGSGTSQLLRFSAGKWTAAQFISNTFGGGRGAAAGGDSVYALGMYFDGSYNYSWSGIHAPGGPRNEGEPASHSEFAGSRFVAGDGDTEAPQQRDTPPGNGINDWEVGELLTADTGLGGRGLVFTTLPDAPDPRKPLSPIAACGVLGRPNAEYAIPGTTIHSQVIPFGCYLPAIEENGANQVNPEAATRDPWDPPGPAWVVDAYGLNAVDMVGSGADGWAAGARGALVQFGDWRDDEPAPPKLGGAPAALPDASAYDGYRAPPSDAEPGAVPARMQRPLSRSDRLHAVSYGAPEPDRPQTVRPHATTKIVMSRDGSEGWAIGPLGNGALFYPRVNAEMSLYHFDGDRWRRCNPSPVGELVPADPACASLEPLLQHKIGTTAAPIRLFAAARVPLEYDDDPSNDNEFEVVAAGTHELQGLTSPDCRVVRYRNGRWAQEPRESVAELKRGSACPGQSFDTDYDIEFAAPDDGWLVSGRDVDLGVYHYDGKRWVPCILTSTRLNAEECGNQGADGQRLPTASAGSGNRDVVKGLVRAGRRIYMFGARQLAAAAGSSARPAPYIIYRDPGRCDDPAAGTDGCWRMRGGGLDPAFGVEPVFTPPYTGNEAVDRWITPVSEPTELQGSILSLAVRRTDDGYRGWAAGSIKHAAIGAGSASTRPDAVMLRTDGDGWSEWRKRDAALDYVAAGSAARNQQSQPLSLLPESLLMLPEGSPGGIEAVMALRDPNVRLLGFDREADRWETLRPNPFKYAAEGYGFSDRRFAAVAEDGRGGFWVATSTKADGQADVTQGANAWFHRYTTLVPQEVFEEVPNPVTGGRVTAIGGRADGTLWLGTNAGVVFRYDRLTGWERATIPGWDFGRIVTRTSAINAIAVGPGGEGLAVGEGGRIADLEPEHVRLDPAAGRPCDVGAVVAPCGSAKDLQAVAIAPDGSAMIGGARRALLWRPPGEAFRSIAKPPVAVSATITGIALPQRGSAWITTDRGQVYAGQLSAAGWSWRLENTSPNGDLLSLDGATGESALALRAIGIGPDGRGFAAGDRGIILRRTGDRAQPWVRVEAGVEDNLTSVAVPDRPGAEAALIGGEHGVVLTLQGDRFLVARAADRFRPLREVVKGLVLMPGYGAGQVEAWAAISELGSEGDGSIRPRLGANELLHYTSAPQDPRLAGQPRVEPLPDAPAPRDGEIAFAAFGKSDCPIDSLNGSTCPSYAGSNRPTDIILDAVMGELRDRRDLRFALHTGDAYESGGEAGSDAAGYEEYAPTSAAIARGPFEAGAVRYRRFVEGVVDPLARSGLPVFGAIGGNDLSEQTVCEPNTAICLASTRQQAKGGENLAWREGLAEAPGPWGHGSEVKTDQLEFIPVTGGGVSGLGSQEVDRRPGEPGARTHYAIDVVEDGRKRLRLVFADNSMRSLSGSDPVQNPVEPEGGGQLPWLERMVCIRGEALAAGVGDAGCTREPDQQAVVVANTPTYSYGPGSASDVATDATQVETMLMRHRVSMIVSGRLGWNGRYWATAPGVHEPCPGGDYQDAPPDPETRVCGRSAGEADAAPARKRISGVLESLDAPATPDPTGLTTAAGGLTGGILPAVVAASAGGNFGPDGRGEGEAAAGFWRGYTVVRLDPEGDPRGIVVEQRPVVDWLLVTARSHAVQPGTRLPLQGVGREPIGIEQSLSTAVTRPPRYLKINSPAITHRYDLLEADPARPWLPKVVEGNGNPHGYVSFDPAIGTIDRQTGVVRASRANHPRIYAVALLSVGKRATSFPLVFEPKRSYVAPKTRLPVPPPVPPVRVLAFGAQSLAPPPSPPPATPPPINTSLTLPAPPGLPNLSGATPVPIAPPAPPAPPPPPSSQGAVPVNLSITPVGVAVPPTPGVTAQPTPPVQPSPPSGARREAKQRQAATAKSEEGASPESQQVDTAQAPVNPTGAAYTRRDRVRASAGSFTGVAHAEQRSAWVTGLEWGGGVALMALALALGFTTVRPTPRRGPPVVPAPAWARRRH